MNKILIILSLFMLSSNIKADITLNEMGVYITEKESSLYVKNNSENPVIVYIKEDVEETIKLSGESLVVISPAISKLESGEVQQIRVIAKKEYEVQKLSRVLIQEIPYIKDQNQNRVSFSKSYNIPVLISPKKLVEDFSPWLNLEFKNNEIINESRYLVKMIPIYNCFKNGKLLALNFDSPYINPMTKKVVSKDCEYIEIDPVSNNGKILEKYKLEKK